jgi:hypothetical protein
MLHAVRICEEAWVRRQFRLLNSFTQPRKLLIVSGADNNVSIRRRKCLQRTLLT